MRPSNVLYVGGLPGDTHESEVIRLFDDMPGFTSANVIVSRTNKCIGFVTFETVDDAEGALLEKEGLEFPPGNRLTIEFGKDKKDKPDRGDDRRNDDRREERREDRRDFDRRDDRRDDRRPAPREDRREDRRDRDFERKSDRRDNRRNEDYHVKRVDPNTMGPYARRFKQWQRNNTGDTRATGTVFIHGLPSDATEREVMHLVRPFAGFKKLRLIPRGNNHCYAFADFETELIAKFAADVLDGYDFGDDKTVKAELAHEKGRNN